MISSFPQVSVALNSLFPSSPSTGLHSIYTEGLLQVLLQSESHWIAVFEEPGCLLVSEPEWLPHFFPDHGAVQSLIYVALSYWRSASTVARPLHFSMTMRFRHDVCMLFHILREIVGLHLNQRLPQLNVHGVYKLDIELKRNSTSGPFPGVSLCFQGPTCDLESVLFLVSIALPFTCAHDGVYSLVGNRPLGS